MSLVVYASLGKLYKDFISLRHSHMSRDVCENYSILVSDVPVEYRSKREVELYFNTFFNDSSINAMIITVKI